MSAKFPPALTNLRLVYQGKTRDTFETLSDQHLLIVATNRLSTHNIVHASAIPGKGNVLTALTIFWATQLLDFRGIPHHLTVYGKKIFSFLPGDEADYPEDLHHRAIIVRKLQIIPVEMIFRAYLAGSLYSKFYAKGLPDPYGIRLPPGLPLMAAFPEPIFTPTDKSETDDERVSAEIERLYPEAVTVSALVFDLVRAHLNKRGIELVDSKFEIGGKDIVADEIATPDSSRFVWLKNIVPGTEPEWLDKQYARNAAERAWGKGKRHPLVFDEETIQVLSEIYRRLFHTATGMSLEHFQRERLD